VPRVGRFVRRGPVRTALWANILTHLGALAVTTKTAAGASSLGLLTTESITLVRSRGVALFHFDNAVATDVLQVALGLGIFTSDAFGIGSTALPGPLTDADWDWVYYKTILFGPGFTTTEIAGEGLQNVTVEVDSKAMRKMKANQTLAWVAEGIVKSGGGNFDVGVSCRHLFKMA